MTTDNFVNSLFFQSAALEFDLELGVVKNALCETQRLSPINLKLLTYLLNRQKEVVSRTELFDAVWPNQIVSDDVLTRAISDIRNQLAKLDDSTKFIETLPKRGYRWVLDAVPARKINSSIQPEKSASIASELPEKTTESIVSRLTSLLVNVTAALLLAFSFMWWLSQSQLNQIGLAVLPTLADSPPNEFTAKTMNENILQVLRKNPNLQLLSKSAVASRPQNPFPYFNQEFGARWLLESRIKHSEVYYELELSLVDARTGIEVRSTRIEFINNTESLIKLAKKLEVGFFDDGIDY